jgi:hypothetical protein
MLLLIMLIHFRAVKLKRLLWAGQVTQMGKTTNAHRNFVGKPRRSCHLEHRQDGTRICFGAMAGFVLVALKFRSLTIRELTLHNKKGC